MIIVEKIELNKNENEEPYKSILKKVLDFANKNYPGVARGKVKEILDNWLDIPGKEDEARGFNIHWKEVKSDPQKVSNMFTDDVIDDIFDFALQGQNSSEVSSKVMSELKKRFDDYIDGHYVNTTGNDLSKQKTLGGTLPANLEQANKDKINNETWERFKPEAEKALKNDKSLYSVDEDGDVSIKFDKFVYGDKAKGIPSLKDIWREEVDKFNREYLNLDKKGYVAGSNSTIEKDFEDAKKKGKAKEFLKDLIFNPNFKTSNGVRLKNSDGLSYLTYDFLAKHIDEIYNLDKELSKSLVKKYITLLGNGEKLKRCADHLGNLDPETLKTWVQSMGPALKDANNIFIQFMNGPHTYFDKSVAKQDFISCYNTIAALDSWGSNDEMNKFLNTDDQPLGNREIYQNIKNDKDKIYLLKYAFSKPNRRAAIYNSIRDNTWEVFIDQIKLELDNANTDAKLKALDGNKQKTYSAGSGGNKKPDIAVRDLLDDIDISDPRAVKKAFKDKLGIDLTDEELKKIVKKQRKL